MPVVKKRKRLRLLTFLLLIIIGMSFFVVINIPFAKINDFSKNSYMTTGELKNISSIDYFGPFISLELREDSKEVDNVLLLSKSHYQPEVKFKLFNLIPIKSQKIKVIDDSKVILGGSAIGLVLKTDGVLVVGSSPIFVDGKEIDVLESGALQIGDVITQIENETVDSVSCISNIINKPANAGKKLNVVVIRKGEKIEKEITPIYDKTSNQYKIGIWVRDDASGIGTLTYINSNNRFGALGHPICDSDTKSIISLREGSVYNCSVLGVEKGTSGSPGELKGLFMQGKNSQGVIEKNNEYGVFGNIKTNSNLLKDFEEIEVGSRLSVKPGKAEIKCCLDGNNVESFEIEIIKTNYQNYSSNKSMVIRVVDEDLIARTGGIVQGMSGSPIVQNGKLVGAVTHVFVNDPTKGFGVYIDWMIGE